MSRIDEGSQRTHFSARKVNSSAPSRIAASGEASLNCGFITRIGLVPRLRPATPTALWLSSSMKFLSPSMMPLRLFSCKPVTLLLIDLSPSFRWFARSLMCLPSYHEAPAVLPAPCRLWLRLHWRKAVSPISCWTHSNRFGRHMLHITNYIATCLCCCRHHVPMTPTRCNPPKRSNYNAGSRTTRSRPPLQTQAL